jgi:uncharacterized RDD family membrane protein YckC
VAVISQEVTTAPASYGRRTAALLVDGGVTLAAAIAGYASGVEPSGILSPGDGFLVFVPLNWIVAGALYSSILHGSRRGQTLGKMLLSIRACDQTTGRSIGRARAFWRWLVSAIVWFFPLPLVGGLVDVMWPLFDSRRQTLHDKVARSVVLRAETAHLPRMSARLATDASGRPISGRVAAAAVVVGLIFAFAADGHQPILRLFLFLGVVLACVDAVTGRSLRAPSASDQASLLARLQDQFATDVVEEMGRPPSFEPRDLRTRLLAAAADGRLAVFGLLAALLGLYGRSGLLSADSTETYRFVLMLFGLSFLAPLPRSMHAVSGELRQRAGVAATGLCVAAVLVLLLGASAASLPVVTVGILIAAIVARLTRNALPPRSGTIMPTGAVAVAGVDPTGS